jgi:hypothetical protein
MLRSNECPEDECCLATNVQARMPMAMVFDDQDNNRSGVMRIYAKNRSLSQGLTALLRGECRPKGLRIG